MTSTIILIQPASLLRARTVLGETLRTTAAYLGVAVLAMIFVIVTVPALRQQVSLAHQAILMALMPDGLETARFIGPAVVGMRPDVRPIDIEPVPGRDLSRLELPVEAGLGRSTPEKTEQVGLLGNLSKAKIGEAMTKLNLTDTQVKALEHYIARKYYVSKQVVDRIVDSVLVLGADLKINPLLILAVMSVESRFNPYAESGAGAQGLMQVMTKVHLEKFKQFGVDALGAFHPEVNIRVGVQILADCIRRRGSEVAGLQCYVGAAGTDDSGYSNKVYAEQRRMALAAKIPLN